MKKLTMFQCNEADMTETGEQYCEYVWFRAKILAGVCTFEWQIKYLPVGRLTHDEDVADWSDDDIRQLAVQYQDVDPSLVEVFWE